MELDKILVEDKNGVVKNARVFKKDIEADLKSKGEFITKDWLARFTKENPEVYAEFRKDTINKISNSEYEDISEEEIEILINILKKICINENI